MKQRKHKPNPSGLSFAGEAQRDIDNHSPKRLQRLRHSLAHFNLTNGSLRGPMRKRTRSPVFGLLRVSAAMSAVLAPGPVLAVPSYLSEEDQARIHLENYRRMAAGSK